MVQPYVVNVIALLMVFWPALAAADDLSVFGEDGRRAYRVERHDIGGRWSVYDRDGQRVGTIEPDVFGGGYSI